jgi:hypothetical protein
MLPLVCVALIKTAECQINIWKDVVLILPMKTGLNIAVSCAMVCSMVADVVMERAATTTI